MRVPGTGKIIVDVQTIVKRDSWTGVAPVSPGTSFGLVGYITPKSTSNRILCMYSVHGGGTADIGLILRRNGNPIGVGVGGTMAMTSALGIRGATNECQPSVMYYIDHPNTTSQVTYQVDVASEGGGQTAYINRTTGTNLTDSTCSTLTMIELTGY